MRMQRPATKPVIGGLNCQFGEVGNETMSFSALARNCRSCLSRYAASSKSTTVIRFLPSLLLWKRQRSASANRVGFSFASSDEVAGPKEAVGRALTPSSSRKDVEV